jgi:hypothetical protein
VRGLSVILLLPAIAHAGPDEKGFRIGPNLFLVDQFEGPTATDFPGIHGQPGVSFGTFVTWRRSPNFAFQLEGTLSDKRLITENCAPCVRVATISLWYFEVPFLLRFDPFPDWSKFHLDVGPELVLGLGGSSKDAMTGDESKVANLNPANIGGVLGAGIEVGPLGPGRITFDIRYKHWLSTLTNGQGVLEDGQSADKLKSSHQIVLQAGYAFP